MPLAIAIRQGIFTGPGQLFAVFEISFGNRVVPTGLHIKP